MDLSTLLPTSKTVPIGSGTVDAKGISLRQIGPLLQRFPVLLAFLSGQTIEPAELLSAAPDAAIAVMAAGIGAPGNVEAEMALDGFALGEQLDLLSIVMDLTLTGGSIGPFVALVAKLGARPESQNENQPESQDPSSTSPNSVAS
jgi:hypothetical protein